MEKVMSGISKSNRDATSSSQSIVDGQIDAGVKEIMSSSNGDAPLATLVGAAKPKDGDGLVEDNDKSGKPCLNHETKISNPKPKDDCGAPLFSTFLGKDMPSKVVFQAGSGEGSSSMGAWKSVGEKSKSQRKSKSNAFNALNEKAKVGEKVDGELSFGRFDGMPNANRPPQVNSTLNAPPLNKKHDSTNGATQMKTSYASVFKENRVQGNGFKLQRHDVVDEDVFLDGDDEVPFVETWGYCLIGCFTGSFPGRKALDSIVMSWGIKCKVIPYGKGWTVFRFSEEEDRIHVLNGGPYIAYNKTLMLKMVEKGVLLTDDLFMHVPTWVLLHDVPLQVWSESGLSKIASKVGTPMFTDKITKDRSKMNYARCLIEVDVSKKPILEFGVRMANGHRYVQKVEYEHYPEYCCDCKAFGHNMFKCPMNDKVEEVKNDNTKNVQFVKDKVDNAGKGKAHVHPQKNVSLPKIIGITPVPKQTQTRHAKVSKVPLSINPSFLQNPFGVLKNDEGEMSGIGDASGIDHGVPCEVDSMVEDVSTLNGDATRNENMCEVEGEWQQVGKNGRLARRGGSPTSSISF